MTDESPRHDTHAPDPGGRSTGWSKRRGGTGSASGLFRGVGAVVAALVLLVLVLWLMGSLH